jgi:ABC-type transport system substrate-binding protein
VIQGNITKRLLVVVFGALSVLQSCVERRDLNENTLIVHMLADPKGLHPTNNNDGYQRMVFQCTQKRLVALDLETGKLIPDVLAQLPVLLEDSLSYDCQLRSDVKWDNGRPLRVEDVLFSFKAIVCPGVNNPDMKSMFGKLRTVEPVAGDSLRFIVRMKERYFDNASLLSFVILMQPELYDPQNRLRDLPFEQLSDSLASAEAKQKMAAFAEAFNSPEFTHNPQFMGGLGPYKVKDWQTGSSITLEKKADWWGSHSRREMDQAGPDRIIFRIIRDMESTMLALKREEVDVSTELSAAALSRLQQKGYFNDNYQSEYVNSFSYTYMGMNMRPDDSRTPFFVDQRVRRAMAHIIPVDEIIAVIAKGKATRMASFVQPGQPDYDSQLIPPAYNLKQARTLLEEAGWSDTDGDNIRDRIINGKRVSFSFKISYMISPVTHELMRMIRHELYKAGIDAQPDPMEFTVFYPKAFAHDFDAMLGSWSSSVLPEDPQQIWHTQSWKDHGSNFVGFGNAYSDSLIILANRELNPAKRSLLLQKIQEAVYEEQPYVFLFNVTRKVAVHRRFGKTKLFAEKPHLFLNSLRLHQVASETPTKTKNTVH